eukprot:gene31217-39194_t
MSSKARSTSVPASIKVKTTQNLFAMQLWDEADVKIDDVMVEVDSEGLHLVGTFEIVEIPFYRIQAWTLDTDQESCYLVVPGAEPSEIALHGQDFKSLMECIEGNVRLIMERRNSDSAVNPKLHARDFTRAINIYALRHTSGLCHAAAEFSTPVSKGRPGCEGEEGGARLGYRVLGG